MSESTKIKAPDIPPQGGNDGAAFKPDNERLFTSVYILYRKTVLDTVVSMSGNRQAAEDIVHDIFTKLWLQRDKLHEIKDVRNYLMVLAHNQFIDFTRKQKNDRAFRQGWSICKEAALDLTDEILEKEMQRLLQLAIQALSPQRKKVFVLGWLEGFNRIQIAKQLNISENTVKCLMQEARRDIRKFMMKSEIGLNRKSVLKRLGKTWRVNKELKVA